LREGTANRSYLYNVRCMDVAWSFLRGCKARANKFREVEGEGTAWYASRTEAVGLGRVVPSSSSDFPSELSAFFTESQKLTTGNGHLLM
jgi:hypothetical protein